MSLLFPDRLSLYLTPERIQGVKTVGWGQHAVEVRQRDAKVQAADNWQDLVRVANEMAQQTQTRRLHIVLSDQLARYATFPWRADLRNAAEDLAMARLQFDDLYGTHASADWHFGFSAERPGQQRLSVAIPRSLFALLQGNLGQPQLRVQSVKTAFCATLQTHRKQLADSGWLVNLEDGRLTLGSWSQKTWNWIYSVHAEPSNPQELLSRIRQEIQLSSTSLRADQPLPIYLHAPAFEQLPFGRLEGVCFIPLKTRDREAGPQYAFALMGALA